MVEVIEKILDLVAQFINKIFLFQIDFNGKYVAIGKIILAFLFITLTICFILDALGIVNNEGE